MIKKILLLTISILTILLTVFFIYIYNDNYRANKEVEQYLISSQDVEVLAISEGYYFNGPGENTAIIFYPGAKVEYTAYAKLMYKIAENGNDCFLLKMPFNMAIFDTNKADKIIDNYSYENWYISGHSMGGTMACNYANNTKKKLKGVITLAAYPTQKISDNLEYYSFYGTEDLILNKEKYEKGQKLWPENGKEYAIEGGNHSGFANYGKQKGDGEAKIDQEEQQNYVIQKLCDELERKEAYAE